MNESEKPQLSKILAVLGMITGKELEPVMVNTYFEALKDLSIEQVEQSGKTLVSTWKEARMPPPAEFRNASHGNLEEQAAIALEICIKNSIFDNSVQFQDAAIMVAIERMGGWETWCEWVRWTPEEDFHWKRKEWIKHYMTARKLNQKPWADNFVGYLQMQSQLSVGYGKPLLHLVAADGQEEVKELGEGIWSFKQLKEKAASHHEDEIPF